MKLVFIRHGETKGNREGRYIGVTDDPLLEESEETLEKKAEGLSKLLSLKGVDKGKVTQMHLFVSPLLRCRQTAEIYFPLFNGEIVPGLCECNFGIFENKNYAELNGNPEYQRYIDSGGTIGFPGGETLLQFQNRCVSAFLEAIAKVPEEDICVFVVHGGTIMALLDAFSNPHKDYFSWGVKNGEGYLGEGICSEEGNLQIANIQPILGGN